ncbi:cytochrome c [Hymenobacter profundi]|uniref:Cytochrome c n=1 Tax=Hymenobacter profundi TaxID=1982110 RepID=A0ABS6X4I1_9BACT|nr:cytochrome c [Hymenobacter profundi]MBW3130743.1 cytochrome c [Hymenobacter profundi]
MSQASIRGALTVGMGVVACAIGAVFLSAGGLLHEPEEVVTVDEGPQTGMVDSLEVQETDEIELSPAEMTRYASGETLFNSNCAQCHAVLDRVVGPALAGITKRRPEKWIIRWVKSPAKVIVSGDLYAVKLYEDYERQQMPGFNMSDQEIKDIIVYIKTQQNAGMLARN